MVGHFLPTMTKSHFEDSPVTEALQFEVKKDKWEQLQNGSYKLTVTMNPTDLTDNNDGLLLDFIKCAPGSRFVLAAVRITEDEKPVKPKQKFEDMPPSQQAGILCGEPGFQTWLLNKYPKAGTTADCVRAYCGVSSRADLDSDPVAASNWRFLNDQYLTDTRLPEQR